MVAQAARVDRRGHEAVAERVHLDERRQADRVAEVVGVGPSRQGRAGGRLDGEDVDLLARDLLAQERERQPREVGAAATQPITTSGYAPASSICSSASWPITVWCSRTWLSTLPSAYAVSSRVAASSTASEMAMPRLPGESGCRRHVPAGLGVVGGAGDDLRAPDLHQRAPIRLLLVADLDHVDLAFEPEQPAGEGERAAPLAGAGLGCEAPRPSGLL